MTPRRTTATEAAATAERATERATKGRRAAGAAAALATPVRVTIVTMDSHLASALARARQALARELPGLTLTMHAAADWGGQAPGQGTLRAAPPAGPRDAGPDAALQRCLHDIALADIVVVTMLFMEEHFVPILPALRARRLDCDAMVCAMSAGEVTRLTRLGRFDMDKPASGPLALLKRLRGQKGSAAAGGAQQMNLLRRIPQLLRFIPGTAQDVRAYFLTLLYWLSGSEDNVANLTRFLVGRYAAGPRAALHGELRFVPPQTYPEVGVYHPRLRAAGGARMGEDLSALPVTVPAARGRVGLLLLRSYLLAGNVRHYDAVIAALEAQGLQVVPVFASGLDARPAIERFFVQEGRATVDAVVSLTGFSLVGGPAYNDAKAAQGILERLDVPYVTAQPVEFQSIAEWGASPRGLLPVESTIMLAIPELDGATGSAVFGGRGGAPGTQCGGCAKACRFDAPDSDRDMVPCSERTAMLAARVARLVALRRSARRERKVALVLFNFPPNAGHVGTAAFLGVFESVHATLLAMRDQGYTVDVPASVDALRQAVLDGNARQLGADANVHARIGTDEHVRRERWLREIEAQWGPAPGKHLSDGRSIFVLGARFGNVMVAVQPGMGYEGDPMRLLFERGFAPTHAFSAFYRWLREDFKADAVLHFGTHGALEFMPGKQTGLSGECWPDRLIGDMPNYYLYAANNPSEGTIAKRRGGATLVSHLTPPLAQAGLYRGLLDLKASVQRWRAVPPDASQGHAGERDALAALVQAQAAQLELAAPEPAWGAAAGREIAALTDALHELEQTLVPQGLHVLGRTTSAEQRLHTLRAMVDARPQDAAGAPVDDATLAAIVAGAEPAGLEHWVRVHRLLSEDHELPGLLRALDGRYVPPSPAGDLLSTPEVLPTGRNLHGFDPFRMPSTFAQREGERLANLLLERHAAEGHGVPESVAIVLWGTDNLKSEGTPLAQVLSLMGAVPRFDSYGRLAGAALRPLAELGRARIDVVTTVSGIFRDLLPLQIKLLAEAALLAACADEPEELNFVRKHALTYQREQGCDLETAALRVFGNADGAYGSNVNHLVENGRWDDEDELAQIYARRKGFAYGRAGKPMAQGKLLERALADVQLAYQNLDSVELGVTSVDTYFDTLGGVTRAVRRARGGRAAPVYITDATRGRGTVRTLSEQVALETRTRMLNPHFYEPLLTHGYEGVRQIESHLTNTFGWSATTGQVQPWIYQQVTETFVLDPAMRERLARLNPAASVHLAQRLLEACERRYWQPSPETLAALRSAGEELEDRLEGVYEGAAA
jgi:magnesium chelatase subunit H